MPRLSMLSATIFSRAAAYLSSLASAAAEPEPEPGALAGAGACALGGAFSARHAVSTHKSKAARFIVASRLSSLVDLSRHQAEADAHQRHPLDAIVELLHHHQLL